MTTSRPLRADAQRNRNRLVDVALQAFTELGPDVPLETIARDAGVGIGTLYRHFPTREALVEATYRNELLRLCDAAPTLLAAQKPAVALREWMDRYVDYMITKRGLAGALQLVIESGVNPFAESRDRMLDALRSLLDAAVADGTVRTDVEADDIFAGLAGITMVAGDKTKRDQAGRLLDLLMAGLRPA